MNDKRVWRLKVFTAPIMVLLIIIVLNALYVSANSKEDITDRFSNIPQHIEVCNVGSSHGVLSFCYDEYEEKFECFNFALSSQIYQYDFRILQNYGDSIGEGTVVFIPYSYFSLLGGTKDEELPTFDSLNRRYYLILPPNLIMEYDLWTDICTHYLPILSAQDDVLDVFKDAIFGDGNGVPFDDTQIDFYLDAENCYHGQISANYDEHQRLLYNQERLDSLHNMIVWCKQRGAMPILITTPVTQIYSDLIMQKNPEFLLEFYDMAETIAREEQIHYYDFSVDTRICSDTGNFMDSHHLNPKGAKLFTTIVMNEIVEEMLK